MVVDMDWPKQVRDYIERLHDEAKGDLTFFDRRVEKMLSALDHPCGACVSRHMNEDVDRVNTSIVRLQRHGKCLGVSLGLSDEIRGAWEDYVLAESCD